MRRSICGIFLGLAVVVGGCSHTSEATFATRNAQVELDLHSLVRSQSNELLMMTKNLESHATSEFSSIKKLDRDLEMSTTQMDQIHMNLPSLLADQDVEIAELRQDVSNGLATKDHLNQRMQAIQTYRKALLSSLDASATRASATFNALSSAQATRHGNLTVQKHRTQDLARDLKDARTMIAMQL
jgi:hypothetical protein